MKLTWIESPTTVLSPAADFRLNTLGPSIAQQLKTEPQDIWWIVLVDLLPGLSLDDIMARADDLMDGNALEYLAIPPEYPARARTTTQQDEPFTLYARYKYLEAANLNAEQAGLRWLEVGPAVRAQDLLFQEEPFLPKSQAHVEVPEGSCVVAVIDNGMAVGHELFRHESDSAGPTSRIAFFWNLDGSDINAPPPGSTEPASIGTKLTGPGLTHYLRKNMHNGLLDDAAFYRDIGAVDRAERRHIPVARRLSHGTHVMGLCAGYDPHNPDTRQVALKRPIIAVNLRTTDIDEPSSGTLVVWLGQALRYIKKCHKRFRIEGKNERPPLVINFSFGNYAGPHDGSGFAARTIFNSIFKGGNADGRKQFLLPAGNSNELQCHARFWLTPAKPSQSLDWRLEPGDRSVSAVQIWLDEEGAVSANHVKLTVTGPGNIAPVLLSSKPGGDYRTLRDENGKHVGFAGYMRPIAGHHLRGHFAIHLDATSHPFDSKTETPHGIWKLTLTSGDTSQEIGLKAWVLRDDALPGFPELGRQSYFDDPEYAQFYGPGINANPLDARLIGSPLGYDPLNTTALVRREGTFNGFASLAKTIVIGGFRGAVPKEAAPMALYSSTGPTNNPDRVGPDASAQSDASLVLPGVLSAGSASGSYLAMPGTSVSTPQVARWVAACLANDGEGGPDAVQHEADAQEAGAQGVHSKRPPPVRSGAGRLLSMKPPFEGNRWPGQSK